MNKHAVLIIAHNNIWTLKKIIKILDSEYFDFFIHIDKKSNIDFSKELQGFSKKSQLYIYKEIDVRWADFTQVECELLLLKKALDTDQKYSYYHLISGVDMPIKNAREIYNFFESNYGKEFVHFQNNKISNSKLSWLKYYYIFGRISRKSKMLKLLDRISVIFQRILFVNRLRTCDKKIMTGANWFSITDEFANYILDNEQFIYKTFKYTRSADELFLQTLLYNSKFVNNLYNNDFNDNYDACMRLIDWKRGNPYVFGVDDLQMILNSNCMFARKFDERKDRQVIELIYNVLSDEVN